MSTIRFILANWVAIVAVGVAVSHVIHIIVVSSGNTALQEKLSKVEAATAAIANDPAIKTVVALANPGVIPPK